MGTCFDHGLGVEQDVNKAFAFFLAAANDDYPAAQYNVAFSYREGNGVEKSLEKAVEWLMRTARNGDEEAQRDLGYSYFYGRECRKIKPKQFAGIAKPQRPETVKRNTIRHFATRKERALQG
nr:hypothetical protein [Hymenobacter terricola]